MPPDDAKIITPSASISRRVGALVYDCFLLLAQWFIVGALVVAINQGEAPAHALTLQLLLFPLLALVSTAFYCGFWLHGGQTLGMRAWKIKLISTRQAPLSIKQCIQRILAGLVAYGLCGAGLLWGFVDPNNETWHDKWSSTRVILKTKA